MAFSSNGKKGFSDINVTPLVDVMLVLLIIFMVTAPMIQQGEEINLPKTTSEVLAKDNEIHFELTISQNKEIYIGKTKVSFESLEEKLKTNKLLQDKKELFLKADEQIPYGYVVKVMSVIRKAGITKIGLITEQEQL
ncbi:protein TolR [bacterium]|nr:protein TolR [bacterium]